MPLTSSQKEMIAEFLNEHNLSDLYKEYVWKGDTWEKGFPDLFRLEQEISAAARNYSLSQDHLVQIARWGGHPNPKRVSCRYPIKITLYEGNSPAEWLQREPENAVWILEGQTRGFGPTYCSKLLHFAVPQVFGALDTRLVRTFGKGDLDSQQYPLLDLNVTLSGKRWSISSSQVGWPSEFETWTEILNHIAQSQNRQRNECPHPLKYYQAGLREKGIWLPADVETALFRYATKIVKENDR